MTAIRLAEQGAADWVPHITLEDVQELAAAAQGQARNGKGERDAQRQPARQVHRPDGTPALAASGAE